MRMRFSCKDELHRPLRVVHHRSQALHIRQDEIGPLVGREPAREADRERVLTEYAAQFHQHIFRFVATRCLTNGATADEVDHPRLEVEVSFPKLAVVDVVDAFPDSGFAAAQMPSGYKMPVV